MLDGFAPSETCRGCYLGLSLPSLHRVEWHAPKGMEYNMRIVIFKFIAKFVTPSIQYPLSSI